MIYALVWLCLASLLSAWAYADEQQRDMLNNKEIVTIVDEQLNENDDSLQLDASEESYEVAVPEVKAPSRGMIVLQKMFDRMPEGCQLFCVMLCKKSLAVGSWVKGKWSSIFTTEEQ